VESLGARLKREREQRKITLDEIAQSTKIGTRFLLAIEEEHFDQLPGGIFNKGFVKAYARSVGVDEAEAVAEYELASGVGLPPEILPGEAPASAVLVDSPMSFPHEQEDGAADSPAARIPWGWFAVALLILAFGFAIWGPRTRAKSAKTIVTPPPATSEDKSVAEAQVVAQTAPAPEISNPSPPPRSTTPPAEDSRPPAAPNQAADQAPSSGAPSAGAPSAGAFLVQIKAREDSWIAISADGRQIMQDTLSASAEKSVGARDQIVIKTGNAGALDISFNGKKLPAQGGHNQVKTLTFDPSGPKF
jgi:cytoskeleton protein RodZ